MKAIWAGIEGKVAALAMRERIMVLVAGIAVLGFVGYRFVVDPVLAANRRTAATIEQHEKLIASTRESTAALIAGRTDPDAQNRTRRGELEAELRAADETLRATQKGLVPSDRMVALLEGMLDRNRRLELVSLRTLAPTPLVEKARPQGTPPEAKPAAAPPGPRPPEPDAGIYKHGVEITVQGSYADLLAYLDSLEKLPTQMFWARAAMNGTDFPKVRLTVTVYTLSLDKTWLTV